MFFFREETKPFQQTHTQTYKNDNYTVDPYQKKRRIQNTCLVEQGHLFPKTQDIEPRHHSTLQPGSYSSMDPSRSSGRMDSVVGWVSTKTNTESESRMLKSYAEKNLLSPLVLALKCWRPTQFDCHLRVFSYLKPWVTHRSLSFEAQKKRRAPRCLNPTRNPCVGLEILDVALSGVPHKASGRCGQAVWNSLKGEPKEHLSRVI